MRIFFLPPRKHKKKKKKKFKKNLAISWNLYPSYYPHRSGGLLSPVCGIFYSQQLCPLLIYRAFSDSHQLWSCLPKTSWTNTIHTKKNTMSGGNGQIHCLQATNVISLHQTIFKWYFFKVLTSWIFFLPFFFINILLTQKNERWS